MARNDMEPELRIILDAIEYGREIERDIKGTVSPISMRLRCLAYAAVGSLFGVLIGMNFT